MKRTKTVAMSVAMALGIGFAGAAVAGSGYDHARSRADQPMGSSVAAMEAHFGAQPGTISYFEDFDRSATRVSVIDPEKRNDSAMTPSSDARAAFEPAAASSAESAMTMTVAEPTLVFSDGAWYSYNAGDWYALEGGEWHSMQSGSGAVGEDSSVDNVTWYYVTEIPVEMIVYSADGREQYIVEGDDLVLLTPVASEGAASAPIASVEAVDSAGRGYVLF
jgi:hypothetical protein